jgi:ribosomal protein S18 acetylase RimI-like enzyme
MTGDAEQPRVQPAQPSQLTRLCRAMARAFVTEAMMTWPLGDVPDLAAAIEASFRIWDGDNIELGVVFEIANGAGMAVWVAPDLHDRWMRAERRSRPAIHALSEDGGARYEQMWEWVEAREPAEPGWYLDRVGVDPDRQAAGLGRALVQFGLDRASAAGLPAFLETATERNVAYYVSLGFRVADVGDVPGDGPRIWFLRHDPSGP